MQFQMDSPRCSVGAKSPPSQPSWTHKFSSQSMKSPRAAPTPPSLQLLAGRCSGMLQELLWPLLL